MKTIRVDSMIGLYYDQRDESRVKQQVTGNAGLHFRLRAQYKLW